MPKITTLLLDCDNTLVLTEPLAFAACAELANSILAKHNIQANYTGPSLMAEFVGQNFRGMLLSLCYKHDLHIPDDDLSKYVSQEEDAVIAKINEGLLPCDGVFDALDKVKGKYDLAVVSSSALRRVNASLVKAVMHDYFGVQVFSAASSLPKPTSKPDPAIYNFAIEKLGRKPDECVAVEDSKSGTLSAVRAGLHVIGYVGSYEENERPEMERVLKDNGAHVVMRHWRGFEDALHAIEKAKM